MEREVTEPLQVSPSNAVHGNMTHAAGCILHEKACSPVNRSQKPLAFSMAFTWSMRFWRFESRCCVRVRANFSTAAETRQTTVMRSNKTMHWRGLKISCNLPREQAKHMTVERNCA